MQMIKTVMPKGRQRSSLYCWLCPPEAARLARNCNMWVVWDANDALML